MWKFAECEKVEMVFTVKKPIPIAKNTRSLLFVFLVRVGASQPNLVRFPIQLGRNCVKE
jgi:hypothetical protein